MLTNASFDVPAAHRFFAADCFNRAWELIDKPDRTSDDDLRMISLAQASLWHWTERPDCTPRNLSIGYWQLSHIYSAVGLCTKPAATPTSASATPATSRRFSWASPTKP